MIDSDRLDRLARIEATLDALVRASNAPTTDEEFRYNQEAQRIWNAPPACDDCGFPHIAHGIPGHGFRNAKLNEGAKAND